MKMISYFLLAVCLNASAKGSSQTITLSGKNLSAVSVFTAIKQQTGYVVFYKKDLLKGFRPVSFSVQNMPITDFMGVLLKDQPIASQIENKTIILSPKEPIRIMEIDLVPNEFLVLLENIEGVIKSATGQPLSNVSIRLKNSKIGTSTSLDGHFSLKNVADNAILQISMVGYESIEVVLKKGANGFSISTTNAAQRELVKKLPGDVFRIQITMNENVQEMDNLVVSTGVFNRKAESYTGSAITVRGDELRRVGNQNVFQSLKNIDPSIYIMDNMSMGSDPNSLPNMNMRGGTTFDAPMGDVNLKGNYQAKPNQPLFILDGFESSVERIFDLDMNLVESLTILRDAAAKALYGSKAANGVVVIETRKTKGNKPRFTYNGSSDITMPDLSSYKLLNAQQKLDVEYAENQYPATDPVRTATYNTLKKQVLEGLNTDWLSKPVRMGIGQKHSVNIDLGKDDLRTTINFAYLDVQGAMKGSERKNLSGGININYTLNKLRFLNQLSLVANDAADSPYGPFINYSLINPYLNPYDEDGNMLTTLIGGGRNPLNDGLIPTSLTSKYFEVINNFQAEYTVNNNFRVRARIGITKKNNNADRYYPATHSRFSSYNNAEAYRKGQYEANYGQSKTLSGDLYLNYNKTFNDRHNVFVSAGVNASEIVAREEIHYAEGFPSVNMDDIMFAYQYNIARMRPSGITSTAREFGMLSMLSYTYMDRFLFDGTFRLNASSVFGVENRMAPFWSLGLGWNLHKEASFSHIPGMKLLKIRGSIGSTGNQNYTSNKSLSVNNYYLEDRYAGQIGSYAANMANPNLKWEQKMDYNAGLDMDWMGINFRFDLFRTITQNLVTSVSAAPSIGFSNVSDNLGKVENKGIEINLAYTLLQSKNGFLRVNGSYTYVKNTILEISDAMRTYNQKQLSLISLRDSITQREANTKPVVLYYDGLPMNTIWAVPSLGIDPAIGLELFKGKNGETTYTWKAGDMVPSGISVPKWRGNIGFNGEYKGFGLGITCTYLGGGQLYNTTLLDKVENIKIINNFDQRVLTDRWLTPGQDAQFKTYSGSTPYDLRNGLYYYNGGSLWSQEPTKATQRFVQDQNELNISSVTVSYEFDRKWIAGIGLERLRFSAYMNDVAKFSTIGIERGTTYPFARTVSFKLTATF